MSSSHTNSTQIREAISKLKPGKSRRYPPSLRRRIRDYALARICDGVSKSKICTELGIPNTLLGKLLDEGHTFSPVFNPVQIDPSDLRSDIVIHTPNGLTISGLTIADVNELLRSQI